MTRITQDRWELVLDQLGQSDGENPVRAWLSRTRFEGYDEQRQEVVLGVANEFYSRWIERHVLRRIEEALSQVSGEKTSVRLEVREELERHGDTPVDPSGGTSRLDYAAISLAENEPREQTDLFGENSSSLPMLRTSRDRRNLPDDSTAQDRQAASLVLRGYNRLNPRYRFEEFVVGESNRYAHASALAIADPKSSGFSPFFLYGGTGLGKTHLIQGIGHRMLQQDPSLKVLYVTSEQFINHFIDSLQHRKLAEFRSYYRSADLLLIDDVQFLLGKEKSQEEFFHTFNALCEADKKVVVSSDLAPSELQKLEDRLRSRFEWGLLVDIQPPDLETRIAILRKKAESDKLILPHDVALFVAERVDSNVRELEGILRRLRMHAALQNGIVTLETASELLGQAPVVPGSRVISVDEVQKLICEHYGIRIADLLGKNRAKKFSGPRHVAQYLCRKLTGLSFPDIAVKFGGKDHTSVIYACRKVELEMRRDRSLADTVDRLQDQVQRTRAD